MVERLEFCPSDTEARPDLSLDLFVSRTELISPAPTSWDSYLFNHLYNLLLSSM